MTESNYNDNSNDNFNNYSNDKISLIKDNIKFQDQQLARLEQGLDSLEYSSENIKNELVQQSNMLNNLETDVNEEKNNINNLTSRVKKLYEKKSCWILTIGVLVPLLIILIIAIVYS